MLENILFILTALFYFGFAMSNASKPATSGDNVMGYGLVMLFWGGGFTAFGGMLLFFIALHGGFDWAAKQPLLSLLVFFGWLMVASANCFCAMLRWGGAFELTGFARFCARTWVERWLPLMFLFPCCFLISEQRKALISPLVYQAPLLCSLGISLLICLSLLSLWMRHQVERMDAQKNEKRSKRRKK